MIYGGSGQSPERVPTPDEKLRGYLKTEQGKLSRRFEIMQVDTPAGEHLAVSQDFRLIPPPDLYRDRDKAFTTKWTEKNFGSLEETAIAAKENKEAGAKFEMLKTAIMHKHMGERFIVVRASRYDDYANSVDNILVDTQSGYTVCAFDEVSNTTLRSENMLGKVKEILDRNFGVNSQIKNDNPTVTKQSEGATLKYGIKLENGKMTCETIEHLPIFLLSLDYEGLDEGQRTFVGGEGKSRYETKLFKYFLTSLFAQIQQLKLNSRRYGALPQDLRARVESFEIYIQETLPKLKV